MAQGIILDATKTFQVKCGRCGQTAFSVFVETSGVTCHCLACGKNYKLESPGGVIIANA